MDSFVWIFPFFCHALLLIFIQFAFLLFWAVALRGEEKDESTQFTVV